MSFKSPKTPKEAPEAAVLRARQVSDLAKLDEQQNIKIKRMLNASRGARMFQGSAISRAAPSNSAGRPIVVARGGTGGGASAVPGYGGGFGRGGIRP